MREAVRQICALCVLCALCEQVQDGRFYRGIRLIIGLRILLTLAEIVRAI